MSDHAPRIISIRSALIEALKLGMPLAMIAAGLVALVVIGGAQ